MYSQFHAHVHYQNKLLHVYVTVTLQLTTQYLLSLYVKNNLFTHFYLIC